MTVGWQRWVCLAWLLLIPFSGNAATAGAAAGNSHTVALKNNGTVVAWGEDSYGQLGLGRVLESSTPLQVTGLGQSRKIAAGANYSLALTEDGTVWAWGRNDFGQLGIGPSSAGINTPVRVRELTGVVAIAPGQTGALALKQDGTVWAWGYPFGGLPAPVPGLTGVTTIAAGEFHGLALKQDGTVYAWGLNDNGQLGDGTITYRGAPVQVMGLTGVAAIAAGGYYTVALKQDGTVWAWGANDSGQLGDGTTVDRIVPSQVSGLTGVTNLDAAYATTFALKQDGTVWAWGRNYFGQLGDGTETNRSTPAPALGLTGVATISVGLHDLDVVAVKHDGSIWRWGQTDAVRQHVPAQVANGLVTGLTGVTARVAGSLHTLALKQDGTVWAWGYNQFGQLGDGSTLQHNIPVQVPGLTNVLAVAAGEFNTLALKQDGTVWAWGYNQHGQLGDGTTTNRSTPTPVPGLTGVAAIAAGYAHTLALKQDGTVWAWGANYYGQLGDGTTTPRSTPAPVPGMTGVAAIAAGWSHTVALKQDGTVWAWGLNNYGQLGDGTTTNHSTPLQVMGLGQFRALAAGFSHTVALKQDGTVWAWGDNRLGQLGDGTTSNRSTPVQVNGFNGVTAIAGGGDGGYAGYSVALRQDGTVWAWGRNSFLGGGHLGDGSTASRTTPVQVTGVTGVTAIASGYYVGLGLRQDGTVWTWGSNFFGQLGDGTWASQHTAVLAVNEMADNFLDLIPEVPNDIPPDGIPPFFVATYKSGGLGSTSLAADVRGITPIGTFAAGTGVGPLAVGGYNVYVAAAVPYSGALLYYQLNSSNRWSVLTWPMADFLRGVALGSQDAVIRVNILQNVDLSSYIGTSILVGYGTSPDEMLSSARYRTIFTVPQPVSQP